MMKIRQKKIIDYNLNVHEIIKIKKEL